MKIEKAVQSLLIDAEWSMSDDDLGTLVIHTEGVSKPTQKQVQDEIKRLEDLEKTKESRRAALLERLGITADEAALLLS
jgi:hypothetical protein